MSVVKSLYYKFKEYIGFHKEFFRTFKCSKKSKKTKLEANILLLVHSLEKGMGMINIKEGYGIDKANNLLNLISNYYDKWNDKSFAFLEGIACLDAYINLKNELKEDVSVFSDKFNMFLSKVSINITDINSYRVGAKLYSENELKNVDSNALKQIFNARHSIRNYRKEVISKAILEEAIEMASKSPSACNRQPYKVYFTSSLDMANKVDELITGSNGFHNSIPNFGIITVDRDYFGSSEFNQWYINGGIFAAYLSLSFTSLGIGNIIMQWYSFYKNEKKLKQLFGISKNEAIICIMGFGYYDEKTKCIEAQRKNVSNIMVYKE